MMPTAGIAFNVKIKTTPTETKAQFIYCTLQGRLSNDVIATWWWSRRRIIPVKCNQFRFCHHLSNVSRIKQTSNTANVAFFLDFFEDVVMIWLTAASLTG